MPLTGEDALSSALEVALAPDRFDRLGVAVSGGGDSMALLHLLADWARARGVVLHAVTVDHGLRPAAKAEAAMVGEVCEGLGVAHGTLAWDGWDGSGNLQDQARRARYRLMTDWAREAGIGAVALGHTADDQAETFVMRLARGSGVDGLSAMAARRRAGGVLWLRPLLSVSREALRAYLRARRLGWVEDPSNADLRFERVRARQVLADLAPLGVTAGGLMATTRRLAEAREALEAVTHEAARRLARVELGDVVLERDGFAALPAEIRRRLMVHTLNWVASAEYGPRAEALAEVLRQVDEGGSTTLHGCRVVVGKADLRVAREFQAVKDTVAEPGRLWDRRWRIVAGEAATPGETKDLQVRALGEAGVALCAEWRVAGLPRSSMITLPSLWRGADLVAAPLAERANGWKVETDRGEGDYFSSILSH